MAYRKPSQYHTLSPSVRCILYCLLLVDHYTLDVNKQSHKEALNKLRERYFTDLTLHEINVSNLPEEITSKQNSGIMFKSDIIRHDVMYAFITECLVEDSDLEFLLTTASRDVISEYCRSWNYRRTEGERCLYVPDKPEEMLHLFIDKLQLDIIAHCTISDWNIYGKISQRLKIPEEVLHWDIDARERFIKIFSQKSVNICRARGIIVGCAGAGKTTLLRKLQRTETNDNQNPTETTVGLEIHEDLFEIKDDTLIDFNWKKENTEDDGTNSAEILCKQLISMTDFAGQVAYYACHQIYLSRRAFYLVVMDMSKRLDKIVHSTDRHKPIGSLFHGWTYKDYFLFWLQSIKTYCEDGKGEEEQKVKEKTNPVILIASHHDHIQQKKVKMMCAARTDNTTFYDELEQCLPKKQTLKGLISPERYCEIECPQTSLNEKQSEKIEDVRKCIVRTTRSLAHWGEQIPFLWLKFERFVRENKQKKILRREELQSIKETQSFGENETNDMLRYFKEIGLIIYFADTGLKENIILDVQWFVDAFKNIITDPTHARSICERVEEWETFMKTGIISDSTLVKVWGENSSYISQKDVIIPYMEKLGILAIMRTKEDTEEETGPRKQEPVYYIPSINKMEFSAKDREDMNNVNKTSILVFSFKTYIPHFFFFRLVAMCFSEWEPLRDELLCKNVAFFKDKGGDRNIAIAVNKTSIQLQVSTPDKTIQLTSDKTKEIRFHIEKKIKEITTTFHHRVLYQTGYMCKDIQITEEDDDYFLSERTVAELETNKRICPNCFAHKQHEKHDIVRDDLLHYWYKH